MIRLMSGITQKVRERSGKIFFTTKNLLTFTTCLTYFDSTAVCDYRPIPQIMVCTANFLMFHMLILMGADGFFFLLQICL
jgi:hypothetical protein